MFDLGGRGGEAGDAVFSTVLAVSSALSAALEQPSGLDDAGRIDAIRALEELVCVATAAQAALAVELDESRRAADAASRFPRPGRGTGSRLSSRWPGVSRRTVANDTSSLARA